MSNSFVIGGGWSLTPHANRLDDLSSYGHVIGVNDASIHVHVHEALTMDRLWFENRWPKLRDSRVGTVWVREKCDCNVPDSAAKTFSHYNQSFPSEKEGVLHGGNSGTCAVNLAFQRMLNGDALYLLGFDMQKGPRGEPYWYPPYPWTSPAGATKQGHFDRWVRDMSGFSQYATRKGLRVYNVTTRSNINCFPKITFDQMMEMIS
jgi:hypothetical protein